MADVQIYVPKTKECGQLAQKVLKRIQKAFPTIAYQVSASSGKQIHLVGHPNGVHQTCIAILAQVEAEQGLTDQPDQPNEPTNERTYDRSFSD